MSTDSHPIVPNVIRVFKIIPCTGWVIHDYSVPGIRIVRFPDGREVRERVITIDIEAKP